MENNIGFDIMIEVCMNLVKYIPFVRINLY